MDNSNKPPIEALLLTKKQKKLLDELEIQYGLIVPKAKKQDFQWVSTFLRLFAFDADLPVDDPNQTGWRVINMVINDYYWTDYLYNTAKKLNLTDKDVHFVLNILKNFRTEPLKRSPTDTGIDPEIIAYEQEENRAYYD